jgi:hypothetical protein
VLSVAFVACFLLAVALACKKKNEPSPATVARAAELKPKVTQLLAQVASLSAKAKSPTGAVTALAQKPNPGTVAVIGATFLEKPNRTADTSELDLRDPVLSVCQYIVDRTQIQNDDIKNLEDCTRLEYAAVIQQGSFTPPDADDGRSYTPGRFSGSVLLFHLSTGELRGIHSLDVSQSDQLELTSKPGQKPEAYEWRQQAMAYLKNHVREAALKKLQ